MLRINSCIHPIKGTKRENRTNKFVFTSITSPPGGVEEGREKERRHFSRTKVEELGWKSWSELILLLFEVGLKSRKCWKSRAQQSKHRLLGRRTTGWTPGSTYWPLLFPPRNYNCSKFQGGGQWLFIYPMRKWLIVRGMYPVVTYWEMDGQTIRRGRITSRGKQENCLFLYQGRHLVSFKSHTQLLNQLISFTLG